MVLRNKKPLAALALVLISPLVTIANSGYASADTMVYTQSGDVSAKRAVVWARCNREKDGRLLFDLGMSPDFDQGKGGSRVRTKVGPLVSSDNDYTGILVLGGLAASKTYYYRARCVNRPGAHSAFEDLGPVGKLTTAPDRHETRPVKFVWIADLAGQGWGRNPDLSITDKDGDTIRGGYVIFEVINKLKPDFAIFAGDIIYADNRIPATQAVPSEIGGGTWKNDPAKDFLAITLDEYRRNWRYNLGDEKLQGFLLKTPQYIQWDDHEVINNWYPGEILTDAPYEGIAANALAEQGRQALFEYNPIEGKLIYRKFQHGKHMELFLLDERSYRGPNPDNYNPTGSEMLGQQQLQWLKSSLKQSRATWKVISTHDPLSLVTGASDDRDGWGQGKAEVLGREVQLAELLKFIKDEGIRNVVFITADVHFATAISYDPARAIFKDFDSFEEFVIGPVHAGASGANDLDVSFGPKFDYLRAPSTENLKSRNLPPPKLQSFGAAEVTADGRLIMRIHDITGAVLYEKTLSPKQG